MSATREAHEHPAHRHRLGILGVHPTPEAFEERYHCRCGDSWVPTRVGVRRDDYGDAVLYTSRCVGCGTDVTIYEEGR